MVRRSVGLGVILAALLWAGPAHAVGGKVWDLSGVATARIGGIMQSQAVTGSLALNDDRTYVLHSDMEPVDDTGAWFELKGKIQLYTQNLLEQITELESELATQLGEPAEVTPVKSKSRITVDPVTGVLSLRADTSYQVYLPNSHLTFKVSVRLVLTGTPV
jgi:hypothetical protein